MFRMPSSYASVALFISACHLKALVLTVDGLTARSPHCCVVIGKIIIDEYKNPEESNDANAIVTIGGGGPQAAWGAAAALAVLQERETRIAAKPSMNIQPRYGVPPPQPVAFLGPIGKMSRAEKESLHSLLSPALAKIFLVEEREFQTPRIQLWHDEEQDLKWFPLEDSWGSKGADGLWRNRPNATFVLEAAREAIAIQGGDVGGSLENTTIDSLFLIMEAGQDAPGGGGDSLLLANKILRQRTGIIGVEPVAFPEDETGKVGRGDSTSFQTRLRGYETVNLITPDKYLFEAIDTNFWNNYDVAARYGESGSRVSTRNSEAWTEIPTSTLQTPTGNVVNPTGAGNAYSAAVTACLGKGLSLLDAGCIGTAVGAAMCEHQNLPPWSWETLHRIHDGAEEVKRKCI